MPETITEPSAAAPDPGIKFHDDSSKGYPTNHEGTDGTESRPATSGVGARALEVDYRTRRIHHPSGAAPPGTPVRARFCKQVASQDPPADAGGSDTHSGAKL